MNKKSALLFYFIAILNTLSQSQTILEDIFLKYKYVAKVPKDIHFLHHSDQYLSFERNNLGDFEWNQYTAIGNKVKTWLNTNDIELWSKGLITKIDDYYITPDDKNIVILTGKEQLYRKSFEGNYYFVALQNKTLSSLSLTGKQMAIDFSPDGTKISYIQKNNIFYKDIITGKTIQITNDGKENCILNGISDLVYEEEFKVSQLYKWSPDGRFIAFIKFDETMVPNFSYTVFDELYPTTETIKYPKFGSKIPTVRTFIYDVLSKKTKEITPLIGEAYFTNIYWLGDMVVISTLNRSQNQLKLFGINAKTAKKTILFEERSNQYIVTPQIKILNTTDLVFTSENDGFNHLYLLSNKLEKPMISQLTKGGWEITDLYGGNGKDEWIYYQSNEGKSIERKVYRLNVNTIEKQLISMESGCNQANFNTSFSLYVLNYEEDNTPNQYYLCYASGKVSQTLEKNGTLLATVDENFSKREFFELPINGTLLNGYLIKPINFIPTKKYPLLMYVYGGPGKQEVMNEWGGFREQWFRFLTEKGYIIACVDNRGTGGKGADFKKSTYLNLGKLETEDQINVASYFGKQTYIDSTRIGIFGWSYGGFMALDALFYGANKFKMAISIAPVTNWKFYDAIYSERHMGMLKENEGGYDNFNPIDGAKLLSGKLLLVHGMADENVHYQNTVELQKALIEAGKQFDFMSYPDKDHAIGGGKSRLHLFTLMTNYIIEHL